MRVIVLTRSDKHYTEEEGGYCIAGLDYDDRTHWVRLLGQHYKMKITNAEAVYEDGTICAPLDIIEVNDAVRVDEEFYNANNGRYALTDYRIQPENYIVPVAPFVKLGRISIDEVLRCAPISDSRYIFGNTGKSLSVEEAIANNSSLVLIKVEDLLLEPKNRHNEDGYQAHYRASFTYNGVRYSDISVTDPDYAAELTDFDRLSFGDTFMIVSLGELYEREYQGRTLRDHFKIVAKIFETVYTIPNNRLGYFHAFKDCRYLERYRNSLQRALWQEMEAEGKQPCPTCMGRLDGALE